MSEYGSLPFAEQIEFLLGKVSIPTERWADVWRSAHDRAFMVAGAYQADLLADLRQAVTRAVAQGTTLREFRREFDVIVERRGWQFRGTRGWRTRVIYETNLRTSYAAGRHAQRKAIADRRPFWRYRHNDAVSHPRPLHLAWDGLILRHDDPWWAAHEPPNGWGCKCFVETLSERDMRRLRRDGPDAAPEDGTYEWVDKVTGEIHTLPRGIDPGWDYSPGASQVQRIRDELARKRVKLEAEGAPELAQALAVYALDLPEPDAPPRVSPDAPPPIPPEGGA